jgi:glutathione S-transferase
MSYHLFYSPGACSMAPHIVLEEIGAPFTLEVVYSRGDREGAMTSTPAWRAINPKGRIPALLRVEGSMGGADSLLTEAAAIMIYLATSHPEAGLLPAAPAPLARCVEWMNWLASAVHATSFGQIFRAQRYSDDESALPAIRAKGMDNLREQYQYIERVLGDGREWAVPGGYSVVDPYLLVFYRWGTRVGVNMPASYPAWARLTARTLARPAVQRALATEQLPAIPT